MFVAHRVFVVDAPARLAAAPWRCVLLCAHNCVLTSMRRESPRDEMAMCRLSTAHPFRCPRYLAAGLVLELRTL